MTKILITGALTAMAAFAQGNQPKTPQDDSSFFSKSQLDAIEQKTKGGFSTRLMNATTYSTAFIRLESPDSPHAHGVWSEIFVIKEGSATLHTSGTIVGDVKPGSAVHQQIFTDADGNSRPPQQTQQGRGQGRGQAQAPPGVTHPLPDIQGSSIEGGHTQQVHAGDVVLVPAGVAHWFEKVETPVVYLDIKFPKAE
jgi:mannose-6-phosphate isomerase-like protein (cupin superfamily)